MKNYVTCKFVVTIGLLLIIGGCGQAVKEQKIPEPAAEAYGGLKTPSDTAAVIEKYPESKTADEIIRPTEKKKETAAEPFADLHLEAEKWYKEKNYDQSIHVLNRIFKTDPMDFQGNLLLGKIYLAKKQNEKAVAQFQKVNQMAPESAYGEYWLGIAHARSGNYDEAISLLKQAENLDPDMPEAQLALAELNMMKGNRVEAVKELEMLIEKHPEFIPSYIVLAKFFQSRNLPDDAVETLRRIETALPKNPIGPYYTGMQLRSLGRNEEAKSEFKKALAIEPKHTEAGIQLVRILLENSQYGEAIDELEKMLGQNPGSNEVQMIEMLRGIALEGKQDMPAARKAYENVLSVNPGHVQAANNLAYLYAEYLNEIEKAYGLAKNVHQAVPDNPYIMDTFGWVLYKKGEYRQALDLISRSALQLTESPEVFFHLGMAHYKLGNIGPARKNIKKALDLNMEFHGADLAEQVLNNLK